MKRLVTRLKEIQSNKAAAKISATIATAALALTGGLCGKAAVLKCALANRCGESYVDTAVKILIAVVIGALVLAALYTLFGTTVMPTVTQRVREMFNYNGG